MAKQTQITWNEGNNIRTRGTFWYLGIQHEIEIEQDTTQTRRGRTCKTRVYKSGTITICKPDGCGWSTVASSKFESKPKTSAVRAVVVYTTD